MVRMIAENHLQRQTGSNNADMMLLSAIFSPISALYGRFASNGRKPIVRTGSV